MDVFIRRHRIGIVAYLAAILCVCLIAPSSAKTVDKKVQNFLQLIQNAKSLDEVSVAFEKAHFSAAEAKEIEAAVARPPYSDKLRALSARDGGPVSTKLEITGKRIVVDAAKKAAIDRKATAMVQRLRTGPTVAVQGIKTAKPMAMQSTSKATTMTSPRKPSSGNETPAEITAIDPGTIRVRDRLTISGRNFGAGRGSVELLVSDSRYICDHVSWNSTRIVVTVPAYLDSVFGDRVVNARLWVKPPGSSVGPYREIQLHPAIREPEITALSSDEIMPGNFVAIEGHDFGGRGSVDFDFGSQLFRGNIREWEDSLITAGIPDGIGGLRRTRGEIIIRNGDGRELRHPITFEPDKESIELSSYHEIDCSWNAMGAVQTFHYFEYFELQEGWLVKSYRKDIVAGRGSTRYMHEPTPGTTRIHNIITLNAPPFTRLRVASRVTIEGPKGTPYR